VARPVSSPREHLVDYCPIDALECQLTAQRDLATRSRPVARLDPRPPERLVVEHPELGPPSDRPFDELRPVAGAPEPPPHLGNRAGRRLQEPRGPRERNLRVVHSRSPLLPLGEGLP